MGRARLWGVAAVVVCALLTGACGGGKASLRFDGLKYPVSLSSYLEEPGGRIVGVSDLVKVGELKLAFKVWGLFWALVPLTGTKDLSQEINAQIGRAGGEGIVSLKVTVDQCTTTEPTGWYYYCMLGVIPVVPNFARVRVTGTIVKRTSSSPLLATSAPGMIPAARVADSVKRAVLAVAR
jgi:hypothetical protein